MSFKESIKFWKKRSHPDKGSPPEEEWPISVDVLKSDELDEFIEKFPLSIIEFYSPRCRPCKAMSPRIRKLSKRYEKKIAFGKVNILEEKEVAQKYNIRSVPTFFFYSYGEKIEKKKGKMPLSELRITLERLIEKYG